MINHYNYDILHLPQQAAIGHHKAGEGPAAPQGLQVGPDSQWVWSSNGGKTTEILGKP